MIKEEILNAGTFYWFKSQRKGKVAVPLCHLTDEQKSILCSGLVSNRYEQCNPFQSFSTHYMWQDNNRGYLLVTDIELSLEIKKKLVPNKPVGDKIIFRITLSNIKCLLNDFMCGKVDESYVRNILTDAAWKPWGEQEWKLKRDTIIKNCCERCGDNKKLILQHTIQPRKINAILYELVGERHDEFELFADQNRSNIELSYPETIQKVPVCPKCGSSQVHLRILGANKGTYVCNKTRSYSVCKYKFVKPDYGYNEDDIEEAEKRRTAKLRDEFCEKKGLLRIAAEKSLAEIITYLNFDHTKTLCNKCAYAEDQPFDKYRKYHSK